MLRLSDSSPQQRITISGVSRPSLQPRSDTRRIPGDEDHDNAGRLRANSQLCVPDARSTEDQGCMREGPHEVGCRNEDLFVSLRNEKGASFRRRGDDG